MIFYFAGNGQVESEMKMRIRLMKKRLFSFYTFIDGHNRTISELRMRINNGK